MPREDLISRTFVELADTLVDAFDVVDLLTLLVDRCVEVLDVSAAGLMLVAPEGDLRLAASSSETMRIVELFAGFQSVHALPMRLRGQIIGALNLFRTDQGPFEPTDVLAGQALADIATIAILQHRATLETRDLNLQLNVALNSRILIEQAKGMLAERAGLD